MSGSAQRDWLRMESAVRGGLPLVLGVLVFLVVLPPLQYVMVQRVRKIIVQHLNPLTHDVDRLGGLLIMQQGSLKRYRLSQDPEARGALSRRQSVILANSGEMMDHARFLAPQVQRDMADLDRAIRRWNAQLEDVAATASAASQREEADAYQQIGIEVGSLSDSLSAERVHLNAAVNRAGEITMALALLAGFLGLIAGRYTVRTTGALAAVRQRLALEVQQTAEALEQAKHASEQAHALAASLEAERSRLHGILEQMPAGLLVIGAPDGHIELANHIGWQLLPGHWQGKTPMYVQTEARLLDPSGAELPLDQWPGVRALRGETVSDEEMTTVTGDGTPRTFLVSAGPIRVSGGRIIGAVVAFQDMTPWLRLQADVREQRARLAAVFENVPVALCVVEPGSLRVIQANPLGASYYGPGGPEAFEGRNLSDMARGADAQRLVEMVQTAWRERRIIRFQDVPFQFATRIGYWSGTVVPLEGNGTAPHLLLVFQETTDRVEALRREEEASRAKDRFLALLSHELRTPLTSILAAAEVLRRIQLPDARARNAVEVVDRNVHLQSRLINDLLDLSRVARGKLEMQRARVSINSVVSEAVEAMREDADKREISLMHQLAPGEVAVMGDSTRLHQILTNLIGNSLKYTPAGGEVRVSVERGDGLVRLIVDDNGAGIPQDVLPRLFTMFEQGPAPAEGRRGLGIGLSLVRSLAEAHGGTVSAYSEGPGRGSRFTVELPALPESEAEPPSAPCEQVEEGTVRILIVDDNPDARVTLTDALELYGHEVRSAGSGEEALPVLHEWLPAVMLTDISLPGMDGYELMRQVRAMPEGQSIRAIAITGFGTRDDEERAAAAGFDLHLTKPVDISRLQQRICELLPQGASDAPPA